MTEKIPEPLVSKLISDAHTCIPTGIVKDT